MSGTPGTPVKPNHLEIMGNGSTARSTNGNFVFPKIILLSMIRFRTHFALFAGNYYQTQIIEAFKFIHDFFCHPRHVTSVSFVSETVFLR